MMFLKRKGDKNGLFHFYLPSYFQYAMITIITPAQ